MAITADILAERASSIKGSKDYDPDAQRNRSMVAGATVGLLFGLYYGYTRSKNVLITGAAGAIGGGILARLFMPK